MLNLIFSLVISLCITFLSIPVIIKIAGSAKLFDKPDFRKLHVDGITCLGGVAIFAGFILSGLATISFSASPEFQYFVAAILIIFFLGLGDDIITISPLRKIAGQIVAALLIIYKGNLLIENMHGFLGFNGLSNLGSHVLTFFCILLIINSFNLIDGVDGLAGTLGMMATIIFGIYFWRIGLFEYAFFSFALAGSLVAFIYYNFYPAKIFMGDTGSLTIGLVCSILFIKFMNVASEHTSFPVMSAPALGLSILIIPLLDTVRMFGIRIIRGRSPFMPDRNHIHHILLNKGLNHRDITLSLLAISAIAVGLTYMGQSIGSTLLIGLMTGSYLIFIIILSKIPDKKATAKVSLPMQTINIVWIDKAEISEEVVAK
jgi:UDP-N-acetylmuramyl pentapeptide phosphotransferase/UDP-N-acetylglucosamine-1-phosphate transferase